MDATVAIVASLPIEAVAMRLMLDDPVHEWVTGDPHQYVVGTVPSTVREEPHRIALVLVPRTGASMAAVAAGALRSYPGIRAVVLCGLASAARATIEPGGVALRLGDVVTGADGIVDYGQVRSVDGVVRPRRVITRLSAALLRADREIAGRELIALNELSSYLDRLTATAPEFRRPDPEPPQIHRGAIGSSDQLLRDIRTRDTLAGQFGVLAFEMESSAFASSVDRDWYIVRGIADYADGSKDDRWHPAAAVAAAAYTRMLLASSRPLTWHARPSTAALGQLVDVLLDLPVMRDDYERQAVIALLPQQIRGSVRRSPTPRADVMALALACLRFPGGMRALQEAVSLVADADSVTLRRLAAAVDAYGSPPA